jgi:hypothetical protein
MLYIIIVSVMKFMHLVNDVTLLFSVMLLQNCDVMSYLSLIKYCPSIYLTLILDHGEFQLVNEVTLLLSVMLLQNCDISP